MMQDDPRLFEAQAIPISEVADRLQILGLTRAGSEMVGPCPCCGGKDRFAINTARGVWNCRICGTGGDGIALVRHVLGCDFRKALGYLCGEERVELDPAERARRERAAAEKKARDERQAARFRRMAIDDARNIWRNSVEADGTAAAAYLAGRGVDPRPVTGGLPKSLRFSAALPYLKTVSGTRRSEVLHTGPAMVAAVQGPDDRLRAVHRTWIDPARAGRKASIAHEGEALPAKMVRGTKKGGAIRLWTPHEAEVLVMGEGIETTLSALVCEAVPGAAYWAGVDLGNMGGRSLRGPGMRYAGIPDMTDAEAFVPPEWVRRLIFIQDGDSDPRATRARLLTGLRRAMRLRPGLKGQIVHAGEGRDLNDVLRRGLEPVEDKQ